MIKLTTKKIKGKEYSYLEKSIRIGNNVRKISKYLGNNPNKKEIEKSKVEFEAELINKQAALITNIFKRDNIKLEFPLTLEEIRKIEEMNLKYKKIMKSLHKKNIEDLNKRFVANYVFESNALEGSSLTLKNVAEIVFEQRISKGKDLREIYDAQNSFETFLFLQKTRKNIDHEFIIKLHSMILNRIDDRLGYREIPAILVGKPITTLSKPEEIHQDMTKLINWYQENKNKLYPLELAFKFHAQFEKIHPFCDGNGRVGRFLLNYILIRRGYFPIIIRKNIRNRYLKALEAADRRKWIILMRFALKHYKETFRKFFEVYYKHIS